MLNEFAEPDSAGKERLKAAMVRFNLSARAYDRILKVARTIADLEGSKNIQVNHISEAISYEILIGKIGQGKNYYRFLNIAF